VRFILVTNDPFETEENAKIVGPTTPIWIWHYSYEDFPNYYF
jgi:hypothetical protein